MKHSAGDEAKGHTDTVTGLAFVADGGLFSVSLDGTMRQWDAKTGQAKGGIQGQAGPLKGVAFGGASKRLALVGDLLRLRQASGALVTLPGTRGQPTCAAFSSDGSFTRAARTGRCGAGRSRRRSLPCFVLCTVYSFLPRRTKRC